MPQEARPEKRRPGFKGPKVPRQEDRKTGFGRDDKDENPLAHLGVVHVAKTTAQATVSVSGTDSFARALRARFLNELDRKILGAKLVTNADKLGELSDDDLVELGILPLNKRRVREREQAFAAALLARDLDDEDCKALKAAEKPVTDADTLKAMSEDALRKLGIRPAKERRKREKERQREKAFSEALRALHLDDEDRQALKTAEKPVTDAKKLSKLSDGDLVELGILPMDRRRARQRIRDELVLLQRQLNNAAKEDNAMGVSQCVMLQKDLDPEQLLAPPRDGALNLGTALCLSARRGNLLALQALLDHGATTEYKSDDHGRRSLHLAVVENKHEAARMLIEAGADIHAPSDSPGNDALAGVPLVLAVSRGATESVWELLRVDPCNKENTDPDGPVPVGKMLPPSNAHVKAFHMAVLRGDKQIVRKFIGAGMPIDAPDKRGWAAIHVACENNHGDLVKTLAGAACKLNTAEPTTGMTPLVIAAKHGYVDIVTYLLDIGVELDEADNRGVTALQSACGQGRYDIVSLLLEQGASTTRRTKKGDTALTTAVRANFQDIVHRLLRHPGVDAEQVNQFATAGPSQVLWSPMQLAAREGFMSVCDVLWKQGKADVNRQLRDEAGLTWTTLGIAASRNHLDVCKLLLRGRARVYPTNEDGRQAVWFAARDGYSAVTLALLEGGGNAAQADVDGLTPALAAALYGHADTIMKILRWQITERRELGEAEERQKLEKEDAGVEIDVYDEGGDESDDSFDAALQHEQIQKRSSAELDVMTVTSDDLLPGALGPSAFAGLGLVLRSAVLREDMDLLELALRLGADPESEDDQHRKCPGQWAVEQAVAHGRIDVLIRVARTGAMIFHRPPRRAPAENRREMAAYNYAIHSRIRPDGEDVEQPFPNGRPGTLGHGIEVRPGLAQEIDSIVDPIGRSPLIYACELGNFRWVQDLLDSGADIHAVDADGWNVLHCAAYRGNLELLELLLPMTVKAGVDVNALTNDGRSALDLAKDGRVKPDSAVVKKLLEHGAEVTLATVRNVPEEHGLSRKKKTEMERSEKIKSGALSSLMPLAAVQAAVSIVGLLCTSQSVYEVPWKMAHISRALLVRSAAFLGVVLLYAFAIPALVQSAPDDQTSSVLSQLGTAPVVCVLIGIQLLVVSRAMYVDPGSKGCRSMPATPESWKARREIAALAIEGLQHLSISFASEVSWNPSSGIDAFAQTFSLTARSRWFGPPPFPAAIACVVGSLIAIAWLFLAGYLTLTLRVMWDIDLRHSLPVQLRADRGIGDKWSEGPGVLLLGTSAYLAVIAGLMRQLHCAPTAAPIEELGGGDKNAGAPRASLMPQLWDDAAGTGPPTTATECWTTGSHIFRAELAIVLLLLYHITTSVLAPFFVQSREATVRLSEIPGEPICTAQPGIRRSYKFDAVARLVKLLFAVVAVFGRDEASLTLVVSLCGNATLAVLASSSWCRPTNHALLNSLWTGVYGFSAWLAVVAWASYLVASPDTWGTVGVLLVGWVGGGLRIANEYLAKTEGRTRELSEEEESWVVAESAP